METEQKDHIFLCDLTHIGQKIASDSFPLGIGCIAAYLEAKSQGFLKTHLCKFLMSYYRLKQKYE